MSGSAFTLPRAAVEDARPGWLKVTCPRPTECGETFYVRDKPFREGRGRHGSGGRSCPYCFAAMRIPQVGDQEKLV